MRQSLNESDTYRTAWFAKGIGNIADPEHFGTDPRIRFHSGMDPGPADSDPSSLILKKLIFYLPQISFFNADT